MNGDVFEEKYAVLDLFLQYRIQCGEKYIQISLKNVNHFGILSLSYTADDEWLLVKPLTVYPIS
jgi:hypothetical protein